LFVVAMFSVFWVFFVVWGVFLGSLAAEGGGGVVIPISRYYH
jgi:uncharacterized protein HemY